MSADIALRDLLTAAVEALAVPVGGTIEARRVSLEDALNRVSVVRMALCHALDTDDLAGAADLIDDALIAHPGGVAMPG